LIYAAYWLLGIPILNMGVFAISLADPSNITGVLLGVLSAMVFWSSRWRVPATVLAGVVLAVNTLTAGQNVRELPGLGG
jgi:hypothetical protein